MMPKTPTYAQQSQARPKGKISKSATPEASQKTARGSMGPLLWEEGESSELQEQCQQVICQIDAIVATLSPTRLLTPKLGIKEGKAKPLVVSDPVTPMPLGPNFLHLAMEQYGLWLNEQGELVLTNLESPSISPPTTLVFRALRPYQWVWTWGWLGSSIAP